MKAAMEAMGKGQSISQASLNHSVPKTTLGDRTHGCVQHSVKPGSRPYLEQSEEIELVSFIEQCASIGYAKISRVLLNQQQKAKGCLERT